MIIANLEEMLNHKLGNEYDYKEHRWLNTQLTCGCIAAICLDVEITDEDRKFIIKQFNKIASLQTLIKEVFHFPEETIPQYLDKFKKELEETQESLSQFIMDKRKQYDFPNGIDCNSEYYSLKLKQSLSCKG